MPRELRLAELLCRRACTAPGSATATVWPAATLGAPQTIVRGSSSPTSTSQTRSRSAFGCCSALSTRPTTKPSARGRADVRDPLDLDRRSSSARSASSSASTARGRSTRLSQLSGTLIRTAPGSGRRSRRTGAGRGRRACSIAIRSIPIPKAKPWTLLGVVAVRRDEAEDVRVDHPGAEDLDPAGALAERVARRRRGSSPLPPQRKQETSTSTLGSVKGKKCGPEAGLALGAEDRPGELVERAREVGERDVLADREALDLVEHRRVRGVDVSRR